MTRNIVFKIIKDILKKNPLLTVSLIFSSIALIVVSLIPPQLLRLVVDRNMVPKELDGLIGLAMIYVVATLLIGVLDFVKNGILTVFGQKIVKKLRDILAKKLQRINITYFSYNSSGEITSRFNNDVDAVNLIFSEGLVNMLIDGFKIIGIVASIWFFSYKLGIVTMALIPSIYLITRAFQKRMLIAQSENLEQLGRVNNHISESLKNVHMIKAFSKEEYMENVYEDRLEQNFNTINKVNFYDSVYTPAIQILRAVTIALIVVLSADKLSFLGISLGMIAASIELISNLFAPIETLGKEIQLFQKSISGVKRINKFYIEPEDDKKSDDLLAKDIIKNVKGPLIQFKDLSFSYSPDAVILKDIDLDIEKEATVSFAGRTGVGKSTLLKLIMGLLKPDTGKIFINNVDVYEISNVEKRKLFGYVEQSFSFVKGSVADQISLGDASITRGQIEDIIKFVGLDDYVNALTNGYDTVINGEADFSQGQKQLLSIARALVTQPPILLLDEITASLDSITEEKVVKILGKAMKGRTILSIAHRLSSMEASDKIVLLENGSIRNSGTLKEILEIDKWFATHLKLEKDTWSN